VLNAALDINGTGNGLDNTFLGSGGNNLLNGLAGRDSMSGRAGADTLVGGAGSDTMTGGSGADTFVFHDLNDFEASGPVERLTDFNRVEGDKLDFSAFDGNSTTAGVQGFTFIGSAAFTHHAGEMHYAATSGGGAGPGRRQRRRRCGFLDHDGGSEHDAECGLHLPPVGCRISCNSTCLIFNQRVPRLSDFRAAGDLRSGHAAEPLRQASTGLPCPE